LPPRIEEGLCLLWGRKQTSPISLVASRSRRELNLFATMHIGHCSTWAPAALHPSRPSNPRCSSERDVEELHVLAPPSATMRRGCLTLAGQTHCLSLELRRKESFPRLQVQRRYLVQDRIGWLRSDAASRSLALRAYDPWRAALARAIQAFESLFLLHLGGTNGGTQLVRIEKTRLSAARKL